MLGILVLWDHDDTGKTDWVMKVLNLKKAVSTYFKLGRVKSSNNLQNQLSRVELYSWNVIINELFITQVPAKSLLHPVKFRAQKIAEKTVGAY